MDQNTIALLLAALIGGILSAGGGFLANYYIQSASRKDDKQKGIRNMVESMYKEVLQVEDSYQSILDLQEEHSNPPQEIDYDPYVAISAEVAFNKGIAGGVDSIEQSIKDIDLLVALYLSPLQDAFSKYQDGIVRLIEVIKSGTSNPEEVLSIEDLKKIGKQFQLSLSTLLKKEGYSYL